MIINYYELNLLLLITFNVHQTPLNRSTLGLKLFGYISWYYSDEKLHRSIT
jgi:hypothetical protein